MLNPTFEETLAYYARVQDAMPATGRLAWDHTPPSTPPSGDQVDLSWFARGQTFVVQVKPSTSTKIPVVNFSRIVFDSTLSFWRDSMTQFSRSAPSLNWQRWDQLREFSLTRDLDETEQLEFDALAVLAAEQEEQETQAGQRHFDELKARHDQSLAAIWNLTNTLEKALASAEQQER